MTEFTWNKVRWKSFCAEEKCLQIKGMSPQAYLASPIFPHFYYGNHNFLSTATIFNFTSQRLADKYRFSGLMTLEGRTELDPNPVILSLLSREIFWALPYPNGPWYAKRSLMSWGGVGGRTGHPSFGMTPNFQKKFKKKKNRKSRCHTKIVCHADEIWVSGGGLKLAHTGNTLSYLWPMTLTFNPRPDTNMAKFVICVKD